MGKSQALFIRPFLRLSASSITLLILSGVLGLALMVTGGTPAFADPTSTSFNPDTVTLESNGDSATITVETVGLDATAIGVQIHIQHPDTLEVSNADCAGIFSGGLPASSEVTGGTVIICARLSPVSGTTGDVMTFDLTRVGNFTTDQTVSMLVDANNPLATEFQDEQGRIGPGTTNTITVQPGAVNNPPAANDDSVTTDEDSVLNGDVTADNSNGADSDPDGDTITVATVNGSAANVGTQITLASGALLTVNSDGTFSYDPNGQFESLAAGADDTDGFTYTLTDGVAPSNQATVTITVLGVNDAPIAFDDISASFTTNEDTAFTTGNVLDNDQDPDGPDPLSVQSFDDSPAMGTIGLVTNNHDGTFFYNPIFQFESLNDGETATDTFTYIATDGVTGSNTATVTITIIGITDGVTTGNLTGKVTDANTTGPINGASVEAVGTSGEGTFTTSTTGSGVYTLPDLPAGTYDVTASAPGYDSNTQQATVTAGLTSTLDFALQPTVTTGEISGTVTDASTTGPINGASVEAVGTSGEGTFTTSTTGSGAYTLPGLPAGTYDVTASAPGYDSDTQQATVTAGQTTTLDFALQPLVIVPDVVGLPQADAEAAILAAGLTVGTVTTANDPTVPAGDVISQNPAAGTSVAPGSAVDLVVSLGPAQGTISGTVTDDSNDNPINGASVEAVGTSGEGTFTASTTGSGVYTLANLPAGTYDVTASAPGYDSDTQQATVTAGQTTTLDFALQVSTPPPGGPNVDPQTFSVNENSPNGTFVGTVAATEPNGRDLTFTVTGGTGATAFAIGANSGDITVADSSQLDFETTSSFSLVVQVSNGSQTDSANMTINLNDVNEPPVADAGADQSVQVGDNVTLDGSGSFDPEGDLLTFSWSLTTAPTGSAATLSDPTLVNPTFVADVASDYVARLVVNDGAQDSAPDTVTITTTAANTPPVADAGADQSVQVGDTVTLDGSGSFDPDGDLLTFNWSLTTAPTGSAATLSDPTLVNPTFVADVAGDYVAQLVVNDGTQDSAPDNVTITAAAANIPPVADAGADQNVQVGDIVTLDGSGSSDSNANSLTFDWSLITVPAGSTAALTGSDTISPSLVADLPGTYEVQLVVNDGTQDSAPDTVTIEAFDLIVGLPNPGEFAVVSAPQLLSELPTFSQDDPDGTGVVLAYLDNAFIGPGDPGFDDALVKPVSAFYVSASSPATVGFRFAQVTSPGQTSMSLTSEWNLIGTNNAGPAQDELSQIQTTAQAPGLITLHVPNAQNSNKDTGHEDWEADGDRDLNANPITALPDRDLSVLDGYWVFMAGPRTYSKQLKIN